MSSLSEKSVIPPTVTVQHVTPDMVQIALSGEWVIHASLPNPKEIVDKIGGSAAHALQFDTTALNAWDSRLLTFLLAFLSYCTEKGIETHLGGLPKGVQGLLKLAWAVPERQNVSRPHFSHPLEKIGHCVLTVFRECNELVDFVGEIALATAKLAIGRARFRVSDFYHAFQECGPSALPIVALISLLVGMILAFVGAVQLKLFGAQIFVADLVGLGMAREMGAMMTAILMAGRTGAAYAAELGAMTVNDEMDALKTCGFPAMEFLVLPRVLALSLATPLLCVYADVLGITGGAFAAVGMFDSSFAEYFIQIKNRLRLIDFEVGIVKSAVFGFLTAMAGCLRGLQCARNATAVGLAATSAVVTGIVFIVVSDAIMTLLITQLNLLRR